MLHQPAKSMLIAIASVTVLLGPSQTFAEGSDEAQDCLAVSVDYRQGSKIASFGCEVYVAALAADSVGKHRDIHLLIENLSDQPITIDETMVSSLDQGVRALSYTERAEQIAKKSKQENFWRGVAGAFESAAAAQNTDVTTSSGSVSGRVDGSRYSGTYRETTIDSTNAREDSQRAIDDMEIDMAQTRSEADRMLSLLGEDYLRPHTLRPGERVSRLITLENDRRWAKDAGASLAVTTAEGTVNLDL